MYSDEIRLEFMVYIEYKSAKNNEAFSIFYRKNLRNYVTHDFVCLWNIAWYFNVQLNGDVMLLLPIGDVKQSNICYSYERYFTYESLGKRKYEILNIGSNWMKM